MKALRLLAVCLALSYAPASAIDVAIDGAVLHQTIDGFGVNANSLSWSGEELKPALDMLVDQLGATHFRVILDEMDWEETNDNADPAAFNWAYYNTVYGGAKFAKLWSTMRYLNDRGIESGLMLNFMGRGPAWMGANSTVDVDKEDEFVETIASAVWYARNTAGIRFTLLAPMNEPDWDGIEGPVVAPAQYTRILGKLAARLDAIGLGDIRFVGPDGARTITDLQNFGGAMLTNSAVMAKMEKWAIHSYGPSVDGAAQFIAASAYPGVRFWVTETARFADAVAQLSNGPSATFVWDGFDTVYNHAVRAGRGTVPHNDLGNGPALLAYDTGTHLYSPRKEFYEYAQLFKFVRPGSQRIGATSTSSNLGAHAFRHPVNGRLAIVGRNESSSTQTVNGTLANVGTGITTLQVYRTNGSLNLSRGADITVTGGAFSLSVAANTIFTLVTPIDAGTPPTIATPAAASPVQITTGTTTDLSVLGADDGGESALIYTWSTIAKPPGAPDPSFNRNASNAAKNATATLPRAGSYTFRVTIEDIGGQSVTSSVNVNADATFTSVLVSPANVSLNRFATQQFTAAASDQFGQPMPVQPAFTWSVNGGGTISANGLFTAGGSTGGPFTITATSTSGSASANVSIVAVTETIGGTGEGTFTDNIWDNGAYINACRFQAASNMMVTRMRAKVTAIAGKYQCAIYSDNAGNADQLLRATVELSSPTEGWHDLALTSPLALTAGSHYWLAIWSNDSAARVYATSGGTIRWAQYNYGPWPQTIALPTGASTTYSLYAIAPPLTPYESWRQANFTAAQLADPAISDWNADPERDGWINFLEYAFGYLPLAANQNAAPIGGRDGDHLTLTYSKNKAATDITVRAEVSGDLASWSSAPADVQQQWQLLDGATLQTITARDLTPSPPATQRFMRLRVTQP